ncbi:NRDE family protein [Ornithinibacillus scapharcae]|uniref:NRDE family protein n=1 Tax=Ornithinibacillus scapharcae TaxID=1147159 RepID=UPI000225B016|nr:NRDE family protein [Ornithinibacillus scapharcae]
MCLILFQFQQHSNYKLVLAANRDESYNRPTAPAQFWEDEPNVLAGRDLLQMGTWLGISTSGRFAGLTNYRHPDHFKSGKLSRGEIVTNFLIGNETSYEYLHKQVKRKDDYVGYNILVGSPNELKYYSNVEDKIIKVQPGIHGLSNHFLDTPWPKVEIGKKKLQSYLEQVETVDPEELFSILADSEEASVDELPDTGIGLELERKLSSMFIKMPDYGTRCSTVLTIDHDNNVTFIERTFESGSIKNEEKFEFQIKK